MDVWLFMNQIHLDGLLGVSQSFPLYVPSPKYTRP